MRRTTTRGAATIRSRTGRRSTPTKTSAATIPARAAAARSSRNAAWARRRPERCAVCPVEQMNVEAPLARPSQSSCSACAEHPRRSRRRAIIVRSDEPSDRKAWMAGTRPAVTTREPRRWPARGHAARAHASDAALWSIADALARLFQESDETRAALRAFEGALGRRVRPLED